MKLIKIISVLTIILVLVTLASCGKRAVTPKPTPAITPIPFSFGSLSGSTYRTLCLTINSTFPELDKPAPLDIAGPVTSALAANGIRVVDDRALCDATMQIDITISPNGADYSGTYCYTGSSTVGTITILSKNGEEEMVSFSGAESTPYIILSINCPRTKDEAPFEDAVAEGLAEGFSALWAFEFLANAFSNSDVPLLYRNIIAKYCVNYTFPDEEENLPCLVAVAEIPNSQQANALGMLQFLGRTAMPAVPALINMLSAPAMPAPTMDASTYYPRVDVQEEVVETLKAITGEDFGTDAGKWQAWWDETGVTLLPTPIPCEYARMVGSTVQVSGVIDSSGRTDFGFWMDFADEKCKYSGDIPNDALGNFDPAVLDSLQAGYRVTLTGKVTDWQDGWVILVVVSIDLVEAP